MNETVIACVHCGSTFTHQQTVQVYEREEDAECGIYASVSAFAGGVNSCFPMEANPSPRRSGIRVTLRCEECLGYSNLEILQHKGQTLMRVVKP
jgi:hypothetical protein